MKKLLLTFGLILLISLALSGQTFACPGCAASLSSQAGTSEEVIWGRSFCLSIYFMLAVVHALIIYAAYRVYKLIKAEDKRYETKS